MPSRNASLATLELTYATTGTGIVLGVTVFGLIFPVLTSRRGLVAAWSWPGRSTERSTAEVLCFWLSPPRAPGPITYRYIWIHDCHFM